MVEAVANTQKKRKLGSLDSFVTKHPLGVLPKGNALMLMGGNDTALRLQTLGPYFGSLPEEILMAILQEIESPLDLLHTGYACKALYAYSSFDELWKLMMYNQKHVPEAWYGSWRRSFWGLGAVSDGQKDVDSSRIVDCSGVVYSDFLFRPFQCSQIDYTKLIGSEEHISKRQNIHCFESESEISCEQFDSEWHNKPFMVQLKERIADWTMDQLLEVFGDTIFYQEYMSWKLKVYAQYMESNQDESPLYLFDCKSSALKSLKYQVPLADIFDNERDWFNLFGNQRPDYRWLIIGCGRSGSGFHKDPNGTSAWNSIVSGGSKYWIMFPPDSPPPGVTVDGELESEVTAPVSVAEWFLGGFYEQARRQPGFHEGICHVGQAMYVPAGWWHLVVNLDTSIAMTGNFVPNPKLPFVLDFLKNKSDQISGFKNELDCKDVFDRLKTLIASKSPETLATALEGVQKIENARNSKGKWHTLIDSEESSSFSFNFDE
ncbi:hypothetical protein AWJ20_3566 [Sugiyamaella lignohabitans]|uniref:JmjC domain-containing protein n=1 Tax=Sugiyamaella lignohabitans TaxID=796027 RepID=A0A167FZZ0_9ASCO|nr:uncharacterized protein AWJ20_3566 [Sugiyamaella lignohabitans]ANB15922.1 hypothetical protein AWJ20_3566 [Sugiyamaella lignohabitans]